MRKLVDIKTLSEIVWEPGCGPSIVTLRRKSRAGEIPCMTCGRRVFYDPDEVREWLARRKKNRTGVRSKGVKQIGTGSWTDNKEHKDTKVPAHECPIS